MHTEHCPYCGTECEAEFVDIGVGEQQCGPFHCENCHAVEIGPYEDWSQYTTQEQDIGWYGHVHDWETGRWGVIVGASQCKSCGQIAKASDFTVGQ